MTVKDILQAVDAIAPFRLTMDFDNTGLLIGDPDAEVKSVVLALDCTDSVLAEAKEKNANLVITHHPVIFHGIKKVCADSVVWQAVRNDINVISAHTNLDIAQGGVNDCLAEILGLTEVGGLTAVGESVDENGNVSRETLGRVGRLSSALSAKELAQLVKEKLNTAVRYTDGGKAIETAAVCGGAGDSELESAISCGAQALITGEAAHHIFIEAAHRGISLIEGGHFHTENIVLEPLREKLAKQFPEIEFSVHHKGVVEVL